MPKRTYQPSKRKKYRFLHRQRKQKQVIKSRRKKGRKKLA